MTNRTIYAQKEIKLISERVEIETTDGPNPFWNGLRLLNENDLTGASTVAVGVTTTLAAGSSATVTNSGTPTNAVLNFGIPQGGTPTVSAGTTTTLAPGSAATVTQTGTPTARVFNFGIPQGLPGTAFTPFIIAVPWSDTNTTTPIGVAGVVTGAWDLPVVNSGGWQGSIGTFISPVAGTFKVDALINVNGTGTRLMLEKSTGNYQQAASFDCGGSGGVIFNCIVVLAVNDTLRITNNNGNSITVFGRPNNVNDPGVGTFFNIVRIA